MKAKTDQKDCTRCLHCKQSKISTPMNIWAFCAKKAKRVEHELDYWVKKPTCHYFDSMEY